MLMTEKEVAEWLKSSFYTDCEESVMKRRVRSLAKGKGVVPAEKKENVWLFNVSDLPKLIAPCQSESSNARVRRSGRLRDRSTASAFDKALELTTGQRPRSAV